MEKIKEQFNPVYNNVEQVKKNAEYLLGEKVTDAKIAIVIGHNGRNFVSSTDWRITTESGNKRILPFSIRPQYPNFVECVAGMRYDVYKELFTIIPDSQNKVSVMLEDKVYSFNRGEALKIYIEPDSKFIATDCLIEYNENRNFYRVLTDENTAYGKLDKNGNISRL
ncbi:MAG: hypothetical protein IJ545_07180 [Alphaproteobacteria bacterium]|nr:hypothetical protein [Alphaproteobacteria bacterium]